MSDHCCWCHVLETGYCDVCDRRVFEKCNENTGCLA